MIDLSTTYLGMVLKNPLVVSAGPLSENLDSIRRLEKAGASAVVLHSLFEEQIELENADLSYFLAHGGESHAEALTYFPDLMGNYFPDMVAYNRGPEGYLEHVRRAKRAVSIPIIGSLNGISTGGWIDYAKKIEEAGADALELNIYHIPTDPDQPGAQVEQRYCELVRRVKESVCIPVAVKLGPNFTSMIHVARQLEKASADALVLFNRFYQPDFDLENLDVTPALNLSTPHELLQRLHAVGILFGRVKPDLAITGGVHTAPHVIKCMMAGARVAMLMSALLKHGIDYLEEIRDGLTVWMGEHGYSSVQQMQGSMCQRSVPDPAAYERANYMKVLRSYALKNPAPDVRAEVACDPPGC